MKKILCLVICIACTIQHVAADSYCVMSGNDERVIESKNMHQVQSVASISKIMSAIIALENGKLDAQIKCGAELNKVYGSAIYLKVGQVVSLKTLLYGLMLRSGNDAALEIALHIGTSEKKFVSMMNQKAKEIGMLNTTFRNASGLDEKDAGNTSTAYDMALLMRYAMRNKQFAKITKSEYYTTEYNVRWKNKNRLLFDFPFCNGGKTGFTKKARRTLVTNAQYENMESIIVTLQTNDDFKFHKEKHQTFFQNYVNYPILKSGEYKINAGTIKVEEPIVIVIPKATTPQLYVSSYVKDKTYFVEISYQGHIDIFKYDIKT